MTYKCTGLYADRTAFIHDFLDKYNVDMLFLQETWLHEKTFKRVKEIHDDVLYQNISGIKDNDILRCKRGYRGVTIVWHKSLAHKIKHVNQSCKRITCVILHVSDDFKVLIINVYMPNDNYRHTYVDREFNETLDNIEHLCIKNSYVNAVMLVGDLNIDLIQDNAHSGE